MLAVVSVVAVFALAVTATPAVVKAPASTPLVYVPGAEHHYSFPAPAIRAAYQPHHYQASPLAAYHYQPQLVKYQAAEIHDRFAAPVLRAAPVVHAAPKPLLKESHLYGSHLTSQPQWAILRSNSDNNFDGNFQYDFETENGIAMAASGALKQVGPEAVGQAVQGHYSYTTPEGQVITTSYTADENGFVASGDHLPQAPLEPELPPLIAKSIAYIRSLPPQPENQQ